MLAQVTSSSRAALVGVFNDPSQIYALSGSLVLQGSTGLVITPDNPPFTINQCAFLRYTGTCAGLAGSSANNAGATASDANAQTNASLLTDMLIRPAASSYGVRGALK